jgi:hypothetical protein
VILTGGNEVLGEKWSDGAVILTGGNRSTGREMERCWSDTDRGKQKYWERNGAMLE